MDCTKITSRGPCTHAAVEGSDMCSAHSNNQTMISEYKLNDAGLMESIRSNARGRLLDVSKQITLVDALVQRVLNMAGETKAEQLTAYHFAAAQAPQIVKMTETLVKLGRESGELMSRAEVEQFVDLVIQIVSEELSKALPKEQAADVVDCISHKITVATEPTDTLNLN